MPFTAMQGDGKAWYYVYPCGDVDILQIISGGQTGADRAGLDWAIANGIPHGGWCPKGRKALDGPLHASYELQGSH